MPENITIGQIVNWLECRDVKICHGTVMILRHEMVTNISILKNLTYMEAAIIAYKIDKNLVEISEALK